MSKQILYLFVSKYKYHRITVLMPKEAFDEVLKIAKTRFRGNKTASASMLIEKGIEKDKRCDHTNLEYLNAGKTRCIDCGISGRYGP